MVTSILERFKNKLQICNDIVAWGKEMVLWKGQGRTLVALVRPDGVSKYVNVCVTAFLIFQRGKPCHWDISLSYLKAGMCPHQSTTLLVLPGGRKTVIHPVGSGYRRREHFLRKNDNTVPRVK